MMTTQARPSVYIYILYVLIYICIIYICGIVRTYWIVVEEMCDLNALTHFAPRNCQKIWRKYDDKIDHKG